MQVDREARVRMERAHVHAWPALRTADIDGWLWRSSGGGSQRANSVSTVDYYGADARASIGTVETMYRDLRCRVLFQTFDDTSPGGLTEVLQARGYRQAGATLTLVQAIAKSSEPIGIERHDVPTDEWLEVYLQAITPDRRTTNISIVGQLPAEAAFFSLRRDQRVISTAVCVVAFGCAVIECVATRHDAKRQGGARDLLLGVQAWAAGQEADLVGLQVAADNEAAIALYRKLGFQPVATNRFWLLAGG